MQSYFFDVATASCIQYDFHGCKLAKPNDALDVAEMLALDIECKNQEWVATEIVVRNVAGACLYSVSVRHPDFIAA
jgi:hypothetical protein